MTLAARIEKLRENLATLSIKEEGNTLTIVNGWPINEAALVGLSDVPFERSTPPTPAAMLAAMVPRSTTQKAEVGAGDDGAGGSWAATTAEAPEPAPTSAPLRQPRRVTPSVDPADATPPPREQDFVEEFFARLRQKRAGPTI